MKYYTYCKTCDIFYNNIANRICPLCLQVPSWY